MDNKTKKIIYSILYLGPFVLGIVGYYQLGTMTLADSIYESIKLYGMSRISHEPNICLMIAEYWAPIMTASALITAFSRKLYTRIKEIIRCRLGAMAVYGDNELAQLIADSDKRGIYREQYVCAGADYHLIMFSDDQKNLAFYNNNKELLSKKKTYVKLSELNPFLLCDESRNGVFFFNVNEVIARQYWVGPNGLAGKGDWNKLNIAIAGNSKLTEKILYYGLLNNIFDTNQSITYHVWGMNPLSATKFEEHIGKGDKLNDCNTDDQLVFHDGEAIESIKLLQKMDRIILTDENDLALAQTLMEITEKLEIHWFSSQEVELRRIYECDRLVSFGSYKELLTRNNIIRNNQYEAARKLHDSYRLKYGLAEWEDLAAFKREDNVAATDYHDVRKQLFKKKTSFSQNEKAEMCKLEHIRWNRFHYLHGWTKGKRDDERKKHPDLVRYNELAIAEQFKDWEIIRLLYELF